MLFGNKESKVSYLEARLADQMHSNGFFFLAVDMTIFYYDF